MPEVAIRPEREAYLRRERLIFHRMHHHLRVMASLSRHLDP